MSALRLAGRPSLQDLVQMHMEITVLFLLHFQIIIVAQIVHDQSLAWSSFCLILSVFGSLYPIQIQTVQPYGVVRYQQTFPHRAGCLAASQASPAQQPRTAQCGNLHNYDNVQQ